jgi:hypothetical protein
MSFFCASPRAWPLTSALIRSWTVRAFFKKLSGNAKEKRKPLPSFLHHNQNNTCDRYKCVLSLATTLLPLWDLCWRQVDGVFCPVFHFKRLVLSSQTRFSQCLMLPSRNN